MKRLFDIVFSAIALLFLSPVFFVVALWILFDSRGHVFFRQLRVGKAGREFWILKFRTMRNDASNNLQITVGSRDSRITNAGYWLRRYKVDELPQLMNVLLGDMSLVGPRPEVPKYVAMYTQEQRKVLLVKPGITDLASLKYFEESDLIAKSTNPEKTYIEIIMPEKLRLNMLYVSSQSFATDIQIIFKTVLRTIGVGR